MRVCRKSLWVRERERGTLSLLPTVEPTVGLPLRTAWHDGDSTGRLVPLPGNELARGVLRRPAVIRPPRSPRLLEPVGREPTALSDRAGRTLPPARPRRRGQRSPARLREAGGG